ncbi:unnamed protein product [Caenorhabditis angaria]|uniref:Uncharacterized protein n=1 Tax=Caenorhabditis angaria TaxID=860376 RepID=A0A9P1MXN4_9PELO|nr:unnamed protein product [Caenorhabditis angaria]
MVKTVKTTKKSRANEPMWISKINRKMSFHKFRENTNHFRAIGQDFSRIIRNFKEISENEEKVYEVTVETWSKGDAKIWVPLKYVQTTGEMLEKFEREQEGNEVEESTIIENDVTISEFIYQQQKSSSDSEASEISSIKSGKSNTSC